MDNELIKWFRVGSNTILALQVRRLQPLVALEYSGATDELKALTIAHQEAQLLASESGGQWLQGDPRPSFSPLFPPHILCALVAPCGLYLVEWSTKKL